MAGRYPLRTGRVALAQPVTRLAKVQARIPQLLVGRKPPRRIHQRRSLRVEEQLVSNDVPVICQCFDGLSVDQKFNFFQDRTADQWCVIIPGRQSRQRN